MVGNARKLPRLFGRSSRTVALRKATALMTVIISLSGACFSIGALSEAEHRTASFKEVSPDVFLFADTCNAYVIRSGEKGIAIDCGSAKFLDQLTEIGVKQVEWVLFTHHHRDQCQGVRRIIQHGARLAVPESEREFFSGADEFWRNVDIYRRYRFKPDFFVLAESVPGIERELTDGEVIEIGDLTIKAVSTPGHTPGHMSYAVNVAGKQLAFTGDLIHSPGKLWNFHSLQYRYNDCGRRGAEETLDSLAKIIAEQPDVTLPSHGVPIADLPAATEALKENLMAVADYFSRHPCPDWKRVEPPDWLRVHPGGSISYTLVDPKGNGFTIDPGFEQAYKGITDDPEIEKVEGIWITHYHDDHVLSVNRIKERYGATVYAHEKLAGVLEHPTAYSIPCLIEQPIKVEHVLEHGESFEWQGIQFTAFDFPSQTYWHDGLLFEVQGKKYFVIGDALYNPRHAQDDNCRNYCRIEEDDGILFSALLLKELNPEYLITGHWGIWEVTPHDFDSLIAYSRRIRPLAENLIAQPDPNMGMDEQWASFYPYRTITKPGSEIPLAVQVRNHLSHPAKATARLRLPTGWEATSQSLMANVKRKSTARMHFKIVIPEDIRAGRHIVTADITFAGKDYGEVPEAIVDVEDR